MICLPVSLSNVFDLGWGSTGSCGMGFASQETLTRFTRVQVQDRGSALVKLSSIFPIRLVVLP